MSVSPQIPLYTESLPTREKIDFIDLCFLYQGVESQSVCFCGNGTLASVLKALLANLFKAGIHMGPFHIQVKICQNQILNIHREFALIEKDHSAIVESYEYFRKVFRFQILVAFPAPNAISTFKLFSELCQNAILSPQVILTCTI